MAIKTVPVFEAKNRFSELITAVEQGDQVAAGFRWRILWCGALAADASGQRECVGRMLKRLRRIRAGLMLERSEGRCAKQAGLMDFVVDNSVVRGWFIGNQATDYTEAVAARLLDEPAHMPALWQFEFASVLRTACKRGGSMRGTRTRCSTRWGLLIV